ncbi:MAG: pseudouridine synthase [Lutibacter sp.]|uniref:pseudouridine synthase n=1 Tax=Lutibacter sp. TaxID=1925666 RepID=UPI0018573A6B|nr:pseudouridine synthase [Lutibacter sp.]MBT8317852.1 pseudouridine synthase [Lutibacter sp.]NNJ58710.1 pseudouridine synthase [Lutibacter sp.]
MHIEILFEDDFILIVNKPNNLLIHNSYYARNIKEPTLLDLLLEQFNHNYFPVHRLDRKTSGVILLAKQKENVSIFQELFNSNLIEKTYLGIVRGFLNDSIKIESPVKNPDTKIYKNAETFCKPLLTKSLDIAVKPFETSRYSLVTLQPSTGRMHQLRIHMNKISHPIVGDYKYGDRFHNRMFEDNFNCKNLFLHAYTLKLTHPITNKTIKIEADLPKDWYTIFTNFDWKL